MVGFVKYSAWATNSFGTHGPTSALNETKELQSSLMRPIV